MFLRLTLPAIARAILFNTMKVVQIGNKTPSVRYVCLETKDLLKFYAKDLTVYIQLNPYFCLPSNRV